jgi:hypothetical protein
MRRNILALLSILVIFSSCSLFQKGDKYGCPTNGRNVGAERLLSGKKEDRKAAKAEKKAKFLGEKSIKGG